jgi:crotonobetainyl-CoA:carnitine CoA-transferase CaiB-like acyl-CoA transferase
MVAAAALAASGGALEGIRVLDLSRILAGPWAAMLLGDLGADVIKVELPGQGDDTRGWGPPFLDADGGAGQGGEQGRTAGESVYFLGCNRNKRGMAIDLARPEGKALLAKLMARADVLIENFKPGTLARWGFDAAWLEAHAPTLVHCSITGYGAGGPKSDLPGYDFILQAESGLMSLCGPADGEASKYGVAIVDLATGMMAANAIQAALIARFRTGRGQQVAASLYDTGIALLANVGNSHLATGRDARRYGNGHPTIVPYTTFNTADGVVALAVGNDGQFAKLATLCNHPEWAQDPRFARNAARVQNREAIEALVAAALAARTTQALVDDLQAQGVPAAPVRSVAQALADDHTQARGLVLDVLHPTAGAFKSLATPLSLTGTPTSMRHPPPRLGEHTRQILQDEWGLTVNEVDALMRAGVIACGPTTEEATT